MLGVYRSRIETTDGLTWSISEADAPKGGDLAALRARRSLLAQFEPAPPKAVAARLARLFLRFPAMKTTTPEQVAAYVKDLERYPLWAIDRGISAIVQHDILRPGTQSVASPDVQRAVRAAMDPVRDELATIDAVLDAKIVTPTPLGAEARRMIAEAARAKMRTTAPPPPEPRVPNPRLPQAYGRDRYVSEPIDLSRVS